MNIAALRFAHNQTFPQQKIPGHPRPAGALTLGGVWVNSPEVPDVIAGRNPIDHQMLSRVLTAGVRDMAKDSAVSKSGLSHDLRRTPPRSPRESLAGYVLAARIVDKARAASFGNLGEYHYGQSNSLDSLFFEFAGIAPEALREFVATGADDAAVAEWIQQHAKPRARVEVVKWNNKLRDLRPSEAPDFAQEYMEDYIATHVPKHRPVYVWFDIYDLEEGRL